MQKIILVAGARPNFVKVAPLWRALKDREEVSVVLVHTGQHYDAVMSQCFFDDLGLPAPYYNLGVKGGSHAAVTAGIMTGFDEVLQREQPDDVVVAGDVNSTIACALVSVKRGIRTSHVEAGLRSFDRSMPEEINRIATDAIADLLFVSEPSGMRNLENEGVLRDKVWFVGNIMIDSLMYAKEKIEASNVLAENGVDKGSFGLVTIHRPSNVDDRIRLLKIMTWLNDIAVMKPLVFPMHPRTHKRFQELAPEMEVHRSLQIIAPQGYHDFQMLLKSAQFVITDSGGLQEETTWLGVPCITLRKNTERPVTIETGTNHLVGDDLDLARRIIRDYLSGKADKTDVPDLWDGHTALRIAEVLLK